jgi:hypothetical protein
MQTTRMARGHVTVMVADWQTSLDIRFNRTIYEGYDYMVSKTIDGVF